MKLTYWVAKCEDDADAYSVREATKKAAVARLAECGNPEGYGPVKKVTVEYDSGLDLLQMCLGEFQACWEHGD